MKSKLKIIMQLSIKLTLFLIVLGWNSCTATNDQPIVIPPVTDTNPDPAQYNIPFTGVPVATDAVIYQVNMRCFSSTHNFAGVISRLDSIKDLGVNVIYLMPIYPVGSLKSINSPYCVKDYRTVNSEFGTLADLRNLIDGAHSRGMAVILDWVANHTAWDNAWITSNKSWYVLNTAGDIVSPSGWTDVAQLNFKNGDMRKAMIKAMKFWVFTANCDGFRCDYADGPPADFWKQAIDTLRNIKTHKLLMFAEGTRSDHFASGFNFTFGFRFYNQLKSICANPDVSVTTLDNINTAEFTGTSTTQTVIRYLTNHDVNSSDGTPIDLFGGSKGSTAAFVIAAYMNGVPMIYNGQEVGLTYRLTFPFTNQEIDWTSNPTMMADYKKIIAFRNNNSTIRIGALTTYNSDDACVFTKKSGTETILVLTNIRSSAINYVFPASLANTTWTDVFSENTVTLNTQLSIPRFSYQVLKKQ